MPVARFRAWSVSPQLRANVFLIVSQPRRSVAQNEKETEVFQRKKIERREKTPTPETRFSIWTLLRTPGRFTTKPLPCVVYHKNVRSKAVFGP